jgi:rhodanese-related sulfurtransferase
MAVCFSFLISIRTHSVFPNFTATNPEPMKEITPAELKAMIDRKEDFQLIDVREPYEYEAANIGGTLIPMSIIAESASRIAHDKPVVVHCKAGMRSAAAILQLEERGYTNLLNLKGGILAYARDIDSSLKVI